MKTGEIREAFLAYFESHGHQRVPSSPLVPGNDPTLLFTNAGMVQFKDVFPAASAPYSRAASSQRCVRAGGKHNDLENVGYTARHHTFFEMLGNFSFGDYFKREAIGFAWEFLTKTLADAAGAALGHRLHRRRRGRGDLARRDRRRSRERFSRCGEKDNFWSMGDTGPCGPCSEIFYDHGPEVAGGPPGSPDEDGDRYVEIWNLVFMQYDRDAAGKLTPLPHPSVDTGMGLERLAAVMQGVHSNYDIDLFQALIDAAAEATGCADRGNKSLRVIADHIRSAPSWSSTASRRATRGAAMCSAASSAARSATAISSAAAPFFIGWSPRWWPRWAPPIRSWRQARPQVERVLKTEEERFADTLEQGLRIFDEAIADLSGTADPGRAVFRLYDTYGFPTDLTADIARERGLTLDMAGFERRDGQAEGARPRRQPVRRHAGRRSSTSRARPTSAATRG
jgi:alanyl-tRNA synthetase